MSASARIVGNAFSSALHECWEQELKRAAADKGRQAARAQLKAARISAIPNEYP